jgi:hypothetical protein
VLPAIHGSITTAILNQATPHHPGALDQTLDSTINSSILNSTMSHKRGHSLRNNSHNVTLVMKKPSDHNLMEQIQDELLMKE